jgi:NAD(P)-dependent dehydrogenase (short-subunit alcohol dehydrogenase family)
MKMSAMEQNAGRQFGEKGWTPDRLPALAGRTFVVTGGNSGVGFEAGRLLAGRGARVIMASRNRARAGAAVEAIEAGQPDARVEYVLMDLSSLASVRQAASEIVSRAESIDGLVLNAGLMMLPSRVLTEDGFETQFGVNHLGHFLLASLLCDRVEAGGGRFVIVSSVAHQYGLKRIRFEDLAFDHGYRPAHAYSHSKLANVLFGQELHRRLTASGSSMGTVVVHPGWSATNLQSTGPGKFMKRIMGIGNALLAQSAERGSWPLALAAADPEARAGRYYGPTKRRQLAGPVDLCRIAECGQDEDAARRLWKVSAQMTGADWGI